MLVMLEGRTSVERNQERVKRIKQLKQELHKEQKTQMDSPEESQQSGQDRRPVSNWIRKSIVVVITSLKIK